ncbi:MAG: HD family phosphohydrolase [Clostridia bacterium]|nr:HD family phosphohydrolase [Clostridia bacterium]
MVKDVKTIYKDEQYMLIIKDIIENEMVQKMKNYRQHFNVSCFDHCLFVSYNLYLICKKHRLDYISAARAGMVHDLFLYDWRKRQDGRKGLHAFTHAKTAYENAMKFLNLNEKEKDIIIKHMWPVTLALPRYKETFWMIYVDKYVAFIERKINRV